MKLKLKKFDKAQAVEFLAAHVEKGVFGLLIFGLLLFCVGTLKQSPYDKRPEDFRQAADRIDTKVANSTFDPATDIPPVQPLPEAHDVPELVWVTREVWNRPVFDVKKRRPEPKFLPLVDLRVATGYGAIPVRTAGAGNAGAPGRPAEPAAVALPKPAAGGLNAIKTGGVAGFNPGAPAAAAPPGGSVKGKQWAVITGLVPIAHQEKEYRGAFRDARFSSQNLDYPQYHAFDVERAEVPPGTSEDAELKWVAVDRKQAEVEEAAIAEFAVDPVDQIFRDPVLTKSLPRIMGKEHGRSVAHPKIPLGPQQQGNYAPTATAPQAPMAGRGSGLSGLGGIGGTRAPGQGNAMEGSAGNATASTGPKIEHRLFRFFDFSVQPGKSYRYRVRLVLDNPNYGVGAQYLANAQLARGTTRAAPWSDPSPEVSVPRGYSMLAGGIRRATGLTDAKIEVVLRMWDPKEAVDASHIVDLMRGQVANFPPVEVPVDSGYGAPVPKKIPFQTDMLVLDMTGGDTFPGAPRVKAPGQLLVLEPNGKLAVKSELADAETYEPTKRRLKELEDAIKPPPASSDADDNTDDKPKRKKSDTSPPARAGLSGLIDQSGKPAKPPRAP